MRLYINQHEFVEIDTSTSKPVTQEIATRSAAYDFQSMFAFLPNPDPILRDTGQDIAVYNNLLSDAHLGAELDKLIDGVKALSWDVDRGRTKSRYARFIKDWMDDFDWHQFIEGVVNARLFGYQPMEVVWKDQGGIITPAECVPKPHAWFVFDDQNRLMFRSRDKTDGELLNAYPRKFIVPRYRATYTNPYGSGVLSRCFWPVAFKRGGLKLWLQFIERFGSAFITIHVPDAATPTERSDLLAKGKQMIQDAVAVVNETDRLEIKEMAGKQASADIFHTLLEFNNQEISKAITSQTLTTQVTEGGNYATGKVHGEVLGTAVTSIANLVILAINELTRWTIEANYGDVPAPRIILFEKNDIDKDLAERDKILTEAGVKFTKSYFLRTYALEDGDIQDIVTSTSSTPAVLPGQPEFAEEASVADDQAAVDALAGAITDNDLQTQLQTVVGPILNVVRNCKDYGEVDSRLAEIFPEMATDEIEDTLGRMIFLSEIAGRANAED